MKNIIIKVLTFGLIALAFAQAAEAVTHSSHAYNHVLNGIELRNACLTDESVQTINDLTVCEVKKEITLNDGINNSTDFVCVKWSTQKLSYPRKYTKEECVEIASGEGDMSCKKWKKKTYILPQTIAVRTWTENGDFNNYPGSVSNFTFPMCK